MWLIDLPAQFWYGKEEWDRMQNGPAKPKFVEESKTPIDWMDYQTRVMKLHEKRHPSPEWKVCVRHKENERSVFLASNKKGVTRKLS